MKKNGSSLFFALLGGALTALAFPKFGWSFLAWISLIPLFFVLSRSGPKKGFLYGLAAGAAFYGVLLYWIPDVPAHYGNLPMWLSVAIYALFILFLGSFWGLFGLFFAGTRRAFPAAAYIMAPFYWVSFEYALTYVLTGFPWGLLGYSQYRDIPFIQSASWTGVYGISFVCVLLQTTFVLAMRRRVKAPFFAALALLAGIHAAGWMSLDSPPPGKNSFTAAVIQGNVSSETSWDRLTAEETTRIFEDHIELSREARRAGAGLIIWPESTVPLCFSCPEGFYTRYSEALYDFSGTRTPRFSWGPTKPRAPPPGRNTTTRPFACIPTGRRPAISRRISFPSGNTRPGGISSDSSTRSRTPSGTSLRETSSSSTSTRAVPSARPSVMKSFSPPLSAGSRNRGRRFSSPSPTTAGTGTRRLPTSISPSPPSGRSKTAVSFSAPPRPASAASSTRSAGSSSDPLSWSGHSFPGRSLPWKPGPSTPSMATFSPGLA